MSIIFKPWVGSKYVSSKFGVKIFILGESHYGDRHDEYDDFTVDVVKDWGKEKRLAFFTIIAKSILNYDSSNYLSDAERSDFWEHVAFYNYVQKIVGEGARIRPTDQMWKISEPALYKVIENLDPQIVVVLGKELRNNLPPLPENIEICYLDHPSSGGFSYKKNNTLIHSAIETAIRRVDKVDEAVLRHELSENNL